MIYSSETEQLLKAADLFCDSAYAQEHASFTIQSCAVRLRPVLYDSGFCIDMELLEQTCSP